MPITRVWRPNTPLAQNGLGIKFVISDESEAVFFDQAEEGMNQIFRQRSGRMLLEALDRRVVNDQKFISIGPGDGNSCQARGPVEQAKTNLTQKIDSFGWELKQAIKIAINRGRYAHDHAQLAADINATPRYRIIGVPATSPSNLGVLPQDIARWIDYDDPRPMFYPFNRGHQDLQDLKNNLLVVLNRHGLDTPGLGCHSRVVWNPTKVLSTNTLGHQTRRPAYIGLAHELVHAYHNTYGTQLAQGEDATGPSGMLFEHLCVGIGEWREATISENAIRRDAFITQRQMY
jgi:hypothetical protein